jgi:RNA polymerase sigma-70 factor (sigma-E family)
MLQTMRPRGNLPTIRLAPIEDPAPSEPQGGTDPSFEAFFRANATKLYRAVYLLAHDAGDAEDLVQEAFVRVWERWHRVGAMADPVGYLYRTAMNGFRSRWRHLAVLAKHAGSGPLPPPDLLAQVDERVAVVRALGTLPVRMRAALVLTDYLGYSTDEAAGVLGVRTSTVRSLASQARRTLRERMGERDG